MALAMAAVMLFSFNTTSQAAAKKNIDTNRYDFVMGGRFRPSHLSGHGYESPKWNKIS